MENFWIGLSAQVYPSFSVFGINFHWYGLMLGLGITLGIYFTEKRLGKPGEVFWIFAILFGLLGARIYHVLDYHGYYVNHPVQIFSLSSGGMGIFGTIASLLLFVWFYTGKKIDCFLIKLDLLAFAAPLAQALGRWGNFFNGEGFGPPTNVAWKIFIPLSNRPLRYSENLFFHPVFLYESILCLSLFLFLLYKTRFRLLPGRVAGIYMVGYGVIRLVTENMRLDTAKIAGIKLALLLSLLIIGFGALLLVRKPGIKE